MIPDNFLDVWLSRNTLLLAISFFAKDLSFDVSRDLKN